MFTLPTWALITGVVAAMGLGGYLIYLLLKGDKVRAEYIWTKTLEFATIAVAYVEQISKDATMTSAEKKALAVQKVHELLESNGIEVSEALIEVAIEVAVWAYNRITQGAA